MSNPVPEGWGQMYLKDTISSVISGQSPNRKDHPANAGKYGILKTTAIDWGKYYPDKNQEVLDGFKVNQKHEVKGGDILITKAGPVHRVGVVTFVPNTTPDKMLVSGKMTLLRANKIHDARFVAYALSTEYSQKPLKENTTGMASSQTNFTHKTLLETPMWVPSALSEQQKIATILSSVDDVIEKTCAQIDKLKDLKTGMMQELLAKGIGHTEFKDSPVGRIPAGWEMIDLESVASAPICYGIVQVGSYIEDGIPALAIKNLGKGFSNNINRTSPEIEAKYARSRIKGGDVLISVKGTIGRIDTVPDWFEGNISRDIVRVRPSKQVASQFLKFFLQSTLGKKLIAQTSVGTTRAELSVHRLKKMPIPLPALAEQQQISGILVSIDQRIQVASIKLNQQISLKKALMQDLLTGKVRVNVEHKEPVAA